MKKILLSIVTLTAVGFLVGLFLYYKPVEGLSSATSDFNLSPQKLLNEFELDENIANKKYVGKIITVKGKIAEIAADQTSISFEVDSPMGSVSCNFDKNETIDKTNLKIGEEISIKGECTGYLMGVVLEKCIIINN